MDSQVTVFELQDDRKVVRHEVPLTFPQNNSRRLYIVTNQESGCQFLLNPKQQLDTQKTLKNGHHAKKRAFQYGISTKVFSIIDPTRSQWEVRLLLSPSEISRLSSFFNLIGFVSTCLEPGKFSKDLDSILGGKEDTETVGEICDSLTKFLCFSKKDQVSTYRTSLIKNLKEILIDSCKDLPEKEAIMVASGLVTLLAAELAAAFGDDKTSDYSKQMTKSRENTEKEIQQMVKAFCMDTEHFTISHRERRVHIILRNPCPDNWACGMQTGETIEFGQCYKVFSIFGGQYEIKLLQSLQETYAMVAAFHIASFANHLLMTQKWRITLKALLKDGGKEEVSELSQLATRFACINMPKAEAFMKRFRKELMGKCSNVQPFEVSEETIDIFGFLVAVLAALIIVQVNSNEDTCVPVDPDIARPSGVTLDTCKGSMPEKHYSDLNDASDIGEPSHLLNVSCLPQDQPNLSSHPVEIMTDHHIESSVGSVQPQEITSEPDTLDMCRDGEQESKEVSDDIPKSSQNVDSLDPEHTDLERSSSKSYEADALSISCKPLASSDDSQCDTRTLGAGELSDQTKDSGQLTAEPFRRPIGDNIWYIMVILVVALAIGLALTK